MPWLLVAAATVAITLPVGAIATHHARWLWERRRARHDWWRE